MDGCQNYGPSCFGVLNRIRHLVFWGPKRGLWSIPRGSNVVPFWLRPIFFLGVIIYYPKRLGTTNEPLGKWNLGLETLNMGYLEPLG